MYLKLAWRNIWRNKRRTLITAASVFTAVILALLMRSAQLGAYQRMIDNVVSFYSGHIQIHKAGYWDEKTLDNSFVQNDTLISILKNQESITGCSPRIESFALSSSGDITKGAMVVGINPDAENRLTHINNKIISGKNLSQKDDGILVAEGLADNLHLKVNDTLVILGQGYHGVTAAGKYFVKGIIKFSSPGLNDLLIYMTIDEAQKLYGTGDRLTSIAISIKRNADAVTVAGLLRDKIGTINYEVMDWEKMMPEMVQIIDVDNAGGVITISILYMIIAFGIFGTILMMLAERRHEFGILIAIGMKKKYLALIVFFEILILSGLGVLAGIVTGVPIISYLNINPIHVSGEIAAAYERFGIEPIFPFSNEASIYFKQASVVFILSILLSVYPWFRILKLNIINALKS